MQGTGGVSIFALQFAKAAGARVIATSSSDAKLEQLRSLGADVTINNRTTEAWGKAVVAANSGRGVDQVIDVGGAATLGESIAAARVRGLVSDVGILGGFSATLPIPTFFSKQLRMSGLLIGSRRNQIDMIRGIEAGGIRPVIDRAFSLARMADEFAYQEAQQHLGKVVLDV